MVFTSMAVATAMLTASISSAASISNAQPDIAWTLLPTSSTQRFRGLSPLSADVAWAAGTNATILRTLDAGATWTSVGPVLAPEDAELQFRDIHVFSEDVAIALTIGEGDQSRLYRTRDGGDTWDLVFKNSDSAAFYNCLAFEDADHGLVMSDPVDGRFRLIETHDGGITWTDVESTGIPLAREGEAAFAASGTCLETMSGRWYMGSNGGSSGPGRVYRSEDGEDWAVTDVPLSGSESSGVFSVRFRNAKHGVIVGGDFSNPTVTETPLAAWSKDGGATWTASRKGPRGYRSGASWVPGLCQSIVATGPTGSDVSLDGGKTWNGFDDGSFDAVECVEGRVCWASGEGGRIGRLVFE